MTVTRETCCRYLTHGYSNMICSYGSHILNTWSWRLVNTVEIVLNSPGDIVQKTAFRDLFLEQVEKLSLDVKK